MPRKTISQLVFQSVKDFVVALTISACVFLIAILDAHAAQNTSATTQVAAHHSNRVVENPVARNINPTTAPIRTRVTTAMQLQASKTNWVTAQSFRLPTGGTIVDRLIVISVLAVLFASMCTVTIGLWRQTRNAYAKQPKVRDRRERHADKGY